MKTPSIQIRNLLYLLLILISVNVFSQNNISGNNNKVHLTSLQNMVEGIKEKNASIKNAQYINVMVNDMLIENLRDFTIDTNNIAMVEVLVLEPQSGKRINPSIIINTKKIR